MTLESKVNSNQSYRFIFLQRCSIVCIIIANMTFEPKVKVKII